MPYFHVTSSLNRESIREHGLDWRRMGAAPGIAGSAVPEQEGCFLAEDEFTADWFARFDATVLPVDIWLVADVDAALLVESPEGYLYLPEPVSPDRLTLHRAGPDPVAP